MTHWKKKSLIEFLFFFRFCVSCVMGGCTEVLSQENICIRKNFSLKSKRKIPMKSKSIKNAYQPWQNFCTTFWCYGSFVTRKSLLLLRLQAFKFNRSFLINDKRRLRFGGLKFQTGVNVWQNKRLFFYTFTLARNPQKICFWILKTVNLNWYFF